MRIRFKRSPQWITVWAPARCAEANCQTDIGCGDLAFYFTGDGSLYGSRCGHGDKAEREFVAHRISEALTAEHKDRLLRAVLYVIAAALICAFIGAQLNAAATREADWIEAIQSADAN